MTNDVDQKRFDRLYALLEKEQDLDTVAALRWAIFKLENPPTENRIKPAALTKKDYLITWGHLQSLKDIFENKARDAAKRGDEIGRNLPQIICNRRRRSPPCKGRLTAWPKSWSKT